VEFTLVDFKGNETRRGFDLQSATYAAAVTDTAAIITALLNVSDGVIAGYDIRQKFVEGALVLPTELALASEFASVTALKSGGGAGKANYTIPMPKEVIMSGNSLIVTNAAVQAFNDLYISGQKAFISDGENLADQDPLSGKRVTKYRRYN